MRTLLIVLGLFVAWPIASAHAQDAAFQATCKARVPAGVKIHVDGPSDVIGGGFYECGGTHLFHFTVPSGQYLCVTDVLWYGRSDIYANIFVEGRPWKAYSFDRSVANIAGGIIFEPGEYLHYVLANVSTGERFITVTVNGRLTPDVGQGAGRACLR